jgi:TRAP-type C4-dicarboxylate transport system substrate-binding protein
MEAYPSFKFDEVIKYVTDWSFASYSAVSYVAINNNSFNKLSEKDKKILLDIGQEARQLRCKLYLAETDRAISVFKARQGREWIDLSSDDAAKVKNIGQGVTDNWIKDKTAAGLPAQDYVNFIKERVTYWSQQKNK